MSTCRRLSLVPWNNRLVRKTRCERCLFIQSRSSSTIDNSKSSQQSNNETLPRSKLFSFLPSTIPSKTSDSTFTDILKGFRSKRTTDSTELIDTINPQAPHHLHIYAHRHNLHLTLSRPNRDPLLSVSVGNIGIRKGKRGDFDAGYQLMTYFLARMLEQGIMRQIERVELVFRGFGKGREAAEKAIKGAEGRFIRGKIVRVTDATRVKIGGVKGRNPRRL